MDKAEFESIRLEAAGMAKRRRRIIIYVDLGILIASILFAVPLAMRMGFFFFFAAIPPAMFFIVLFSIIVYFFHPAKNAMLKYKKAYKGYFVHKSLLRVFDNLEYDHNLGLPRAFVQTIMTGGDRYSSNDLVMATYNDINFVQADVHTEREHRSTDSNGHTTTHYTTIFRGRFLVFEFRRDFNFRLMVAGKSFPGARLTYGEDRRKYKRIETESIGFNRRFNIYAQDGFEAFYILDPAFIEKIEAIGETYKDNILFAFIDKKLYVAVNDNNDSFEPPHPDKLTDEKAELKRVEGDIKTIVQFVDKLALNRYMFGGKK